MSEKLPAPFKFCLTCGIVDATYHYVQSGEIHYTSTFTPCNGPFSESVPPEDRPINWTDLDAPDAEELLVMDENALSLLADFQEMENVVR